MDLVATAAVISLLFANAAAAQPRSTKEQKPEAISAMLACRQIADQTARLACFDNTSAKVEVSLQEGRTVVVDRAQIVEDQKERFGQLRRDPDEQAPAIGDEGLAEITGSVSSAVRDQDGRWIIQLADGARWRQIDSTLLGQQPKAGSSVKIRRAALGSFKISLESGPAFKAKRIN